MNIGVDEQHLKMRDETARSYGPVLAVIGRATTAPRGARVPTPNPSSPDGAGPLDDVHDDVDGVRLRTHWTRILYSDLLNREESPATDARPTSSKLARRHHEESKMQQESPDFEGFPRFKSPITAAAMLLGIYAAMHLAVGGLLHALNSPAVAATATHAATTSSPRSDAVRVDDIRPSDPIERAASPTASPPPCARGNPSHLECRMD